MGAQVSQVQTPQGNQPISPQPTQANYSPAQQQMNGKGGGEYRGPVSKGSMQSMTGQKVTYSPLSDQPTFGAPNPYPNTIGQWDNASIQPQSRRSGKGKGF